MLPVLDTEQMRKADQHTIEDLGVPSLVLMENAATGVVDCVRERFPEARRMLILCGRGNNGGDGLAAARHLSNGGLEVEVAVFAERDSLSPDAAKNLELAEAFGVDVATACSSETLLGALAAPGPDIVVDALLGTGTDRPLAGRLADVVQAVQASGLPVVAVDVPTGLNASSSTVPGRVLDAELTVTFAALKTCHVLPPACACCGEIAVADIGIPPAALESGCSLRWVQEDDARLLLPRRLADSHKGSFGHLLLVAGAVGKAGAVAMAARTAVVSGAGLVTMAVPEPLVAVVDGACLEGMTHPIAVNGRGEMESLQSLESLLPSMSAVAVGPGMGTSAGSAAALAWLLDSWRGPLVVDADAVNLLAGTPERLAGREGPTVVTPHPGELARLLGSSTSEVVDDRLGAAREAARVSGAVIVAKGYRTVIAEPGGEAWINPTGDEHLATGGSGDVLTGLIAGLLAQGLDAVRAAIVAAWLHGRAGEIGGEGYPAAVPASILPEFVAAAWDELQG